MQAGVQVPSSLPSWRQTLALVVCPAPPGPKEKPLPHAHPITLTYTHSTLPSFPLPQNLVKSFIDVADNLERAAGAVPLDELNGEKVRICTRMCKGDEEGGRGGRGSWLAGWAPWRPPTPFCPSLSPYPLPEA